MSKIDELLSLFTREEAEELAQRKITDCEWYERFEHGSYARLPKFTSVISDMMIYDTMVKCNGNQYYLKREDLRKVIDHLIVLYDNYDEYMEKSLSNLYNNFLKLCLEIRMESKIPTKTKKQKKVEPDVTGGQIGYIYVMKNCGYYKIGRCNESMSRLGEYTKLPEEPEYIVLEKVSNYCAVEVALHERYKEKRLRDGGCEWFKLTKSDLLDIKKLVKQYAA